MSPAKAATTGRIFGYARVSSIEQGKGTSLTDQQRSIADHARSLGRKVAHCFVETETGAGERAEKRDQIHALLKEVRRGDLVLVYALDRWSRDIVFTHQSTRDLRSRGVSIYFILDHLDPSTDAGEMQLGYMAVGAQAEHRRIKTRLVGTRAKLRAEGYFTEGKPPPGYRRKRSSASARTQEERREVLELVVDDDEAALVRAVFSACIAGRSLKQIAREFDRDENFVRLTLARKMYTGVIKNYAGEWIKGRHPQIIDATTFAKAQRALKERSLGGARPRGEGETETWWLRDLARCAVCGRRMTSAFAGPRGSPKRLEYYACVGRVQGHKCKARYAPVGLAEERASTHVLARLWKIRKELAHPPKQEVPARKPKTDAEKRAALAARRERCVELYLGGTITKESMATKVAAIDVQLLALDAELPAPSALADATRRKRLDTTIAGLAKAWVRAAPQRRREIINLLATAARVERTEGVVTGPELGVKGDAEHVVRVAFEWRSAEDLAIADVTARLAV